MLSGGGSFAWLVRAVRRRPLRRSTTRPTAGRPASRGCCSRRISPASGRRIRIRTRAAPFTGLSLRHDRGALARATMEGVAYGLRDSLELLRELGDRRRGRADLRRRLAQRSLDDGSSPPCSTCRSSAPSATRAPHSARRCSPACARVSSSDAADAVARCVRVTERIEPDPAWVAAYAAATSVFASSIRHYDHWRLHESGLGRRL